MTTPSSDRPLSVPPAVVALVAWTIFSFVVAAAGAILMLAIVGGPNALGDPATMAVTQAGVGFGLTWMAISGARILGRPADPSWAGCARRLGLGGSRPADIGLAVLGVIGVNLVIYGVLDALGLLDSGSIQRTGDVIVRTHGAMWWILVLTLTVVPAVSEEIFFRGLVLRAWDAASSATAAIVGSSVLFGLAHADTVHSTATFVLGLYVGWTVLRSGSLWTGIVLHAVNNLVAFGLLYAPPVASGVWVAIGAPLAIFSIEYLRRGPTAPKSTW